MAARSQRRRRLRSALRDMEPALVVVVIILVIIIETSPIGVTWVISLIKRILSGFFKYPMMHCISTGSTFIRDDIAVLPKAPVHPTAGR